VLQTLRPLTIGELLDRTFSFYRAHFLMFVGIAAIPNAIMLLVQLVFTLGAPIGASVWGALVMFLAMVVVYVLTTMLSQGATVVAVSQIQLGQETSVAEAFDRIRGRLGELLIIGLHVGVRIMAGLILLIVPGIIIGLRYALVMPVAVLEETGASESLERSRELTRGHLGRIGLIYSLLVVVVLVGAAVWQIPVSLFVALTTTGGTTPPAWVQVVDLAGNFVLNSLFGPLMTIAISLVYYDERVRKEGFDLEHMLQQLDPSGLNSSPVA
jgi:hypothetical protein